MVFDCKNEFPEVWMKQLRVSTNTNMHHCKIPVDTGYLKELQVLEITLN